MKNQKIITLFSLLVFAFCLVMVSANVFSPATSSTQSGTIILNATGTLLTNCTFYAKSPSTANSSWVKLGTFNNDSSSASVNGTYVSTGLEDSNDYIFNATCVNHTDSMIDGTTTTAITIDNTVPTTPSALTPATNTKDEDGDVTFSATVVGRTTTGCTLYFDGRTPGETSYTMDHTGDTCSYSLTAIPEQTYNWYLTATDGTNITANSPSVAVTIDTTTSAGKIIALSEDPDITLTGGAEYTINEKKGLSKTLLGFPMWLWIVFIIVAIIIYIKVAK